MHYKKFKMKYFIALICPLLFIASCANHENNKMIVGNWAGTEWLVNGSISNLDAQKASFTFTDKGSYSFIYDGNKEEGTYKVENDMLFTKPTNEREIMVKIVKLTKDSLTFDMNRSGQAETLMLIKK